MWAIVKGTAVIGRTILSTAGGTADATLLSLTSLPIIRKDFVQTRSVITDRQLNAAVAVGRTTPGPLGLYVVSVGYFAAGWPGEKASRPYQTSAPSPAEIKSAAQPWGKGAPAGCSRSCPFWSSR